MPHARLLLSGANWVVCIYGVVCFHLYVDGFTMASYRKLLEAQAMKRRRPSVVCSKYLHDAVSGRGGQPYDVLESIFGKDCYCENAHPPCKVYTGEVRMIDVHE